MTDHNNTVTVQFVAAEYPAVAGDEFVFQFSTEENRDAAFDAAFNSAVNRLNLVVRGVDKEMEFRGTVDALALVCTNKRRNRTGANAALGKSFQSVLVGLLRWDDPDAAGHDMLIERDLNRLGSQIAAMISAALPAALEDVKVPMGIVQRLNEETEEQRTLNIAIVTQTISQAVTHLVPEATPEMLAKIEAQFVDFLLPRIEDAYDSLSEFVKEAM